MAGHWPLPFPPEVFQHYAENEELYDAVEEAMAEQESLYDDEEDEDEESEESQEEEEEEVQIISPPPPTPARVLRESEEAERRASEGASSSSCSSSKGKESEGEWNREDVEGLCCPICMEPWSNDGAHNPSCLPCGHLYGMSCIKKWLKKRKHSGKCPQCNKKCALKDVRRIYGSRVVVIDEESNKRIRFLEAKCDSFEKKDADWCKKEAEWHKRESKLRTKEVEWLKREAEWRKREADLYQQLNQLKESARSLERPLGSGGTKSPRQEARVHDLGGCGDSVQQLGSSSGSLASACGFLVQEELPIDGARLFDVNASRQLFVIAQRPNGMGVADVIIKMSLMSPHCQERIALSSTLKVVKDLHFSSDGKSILMSTLGKKLSILWCA